jgi:hypothetical protein
MFESVPFKEAIANLQKKGLLPLNLNSAQIRQLDAALRRQSVFSADTTITGYLDEIKKTVASIIEPKQVAREGVTQTVTEGFNPATARANLRATLDRFGYKPGEDIAGTIKDLSSDARINLVVKTNTQLAQGAGHFIQQNLDPDVVDEYPALELTRFEDKDQPRDWEQRWRIAAQVANDPAAAAALELHGRMAALKESDIWQALGDGEGGYTDTLGNPFPPFAFNSGMWTEELSRAEAVELGLLEENEKAGPAKLDLAELFT